MWVVMVPGAIGTACGPGGLWEILDTLSGTSPGLTSGGNGDFVSVRTLKKVSSLTDFILKKHGMSALFLKRSVWFDCRSLFEVTLMKCIEPYRARNLHPSWPSI